MRAPVAMVDIIDAICAAYGCTSVELRARRKTTTIAEPRQIAMLLGRKLTERSLRQIGDALGGRDHTSVIHGSDRAAARLETDPHFAATVEAITLAVTQIAERRRVLALPPEREPASPVAIARRIVKGGQRAAIRMTVDEIMTLCDALIARDEDEREEAERREAEEALRARGIEPAPVMVPAPPPLETPVETPVSAPSQALFDIVHDFVGVEAMLRSKPSINLRNERLRFIDKLRARQCESAEVDFVIEAFADMTRAEFTISERAATERYQAAVKALAKAFFTSQETANV